MAGCVHACMLLDMSVACAGSKSMQVVSRSCSARPEC